MQLYPNLCFVLLWQSPAINTMVIAAEQNWYLSQLTFCLHSLSTWDYSSKMIN